MTQWRVWLLMLLVGVLAAWVGYSFGYVDALNQISELWAIERRTAP